VHEFASQIDPPPLSCYALHCNPCATQDTDQPPARATHCIALPVLHKTQISCQHVLHVALQFLCYTRHRSAASTCYTLLCNFYATQDTDQLPARAASNLSGCSWCLQMVGSRTSWLRKRRRSTKGPMHHRGPQQVQDSFFVCFFTGF